MTALSPCWLSADNYELQFERKQGASEVSHMKCDTEQKVISEAWFRNYTVIRECFFYSLLPYYTSEATVVGNYSPWIWCGKRSPGLLLGGAQIGAHASQQCSWNVWPVTSHLSDNYGLAVPEGGIQLLQAHSCWKERRKITVIKGTKTVFHILADIAEPVARGMSKALNPVRWKNMQKEMRNGDCLNVLFTCYCHFIFIVMSFAELWHNLVFQNLVLINDNLC